MSIYLPFRGRDRFFNLGGVVKPFSYPVSSETLAYRARVETDGGTVVSLSDVDTAYQFIRENPSLPVSAWYSAQFGYKDAGSGKVSKLYDLSSSNNDVSQTTDPQRPAWTASVQNGKAGLAFTSTSFEKLSTATPFGGVASSGKESFFLVIKDSSTTGYKSLIAPRLSNFFVLNDGTWGLYAGTNVSSGVSASADPKIISIVCRATNDIDIVINGDLVNKTNGVSLYNHTLSTIGDNGAGDQYYNGMIMEILVLTVDISSSLREAVEAHMNGKWGIF